MSVPFSATEVSSAYVGRGTGPMRLLADFFGGLGHGSIIFWCVAAGPYILVTLVRALYAYLRSPPATSASR